MSAPRTRSIKFLLNLKYLNNFFIQVAIYTYIAMLFGSRTLLLGIILSTAVSASIYRQENSKYFLIEEHNAISKALYDHALLKNSNLDTNDLIYIHAKISKNDNPITFGCHFSFRTVDKTDPHVLRFKLINERQIVFYYIEMNFVAEIETIKFIFDVLGKDEYLCQYKFDYAVMKF
jgi:hypothetical protein